MIKETHIQPQPLGDVLNKGFQLGGFMFKKVSPFFYIGTILYFISSHYIANLFEVNGLREIFLTFVNLSFPFFITAYFIRLMVGESDRSRRFKQRTFLMFIPMLTISGIIYWSLFLIGSLIFIVPGILFFIYFLFFPSVIVFEQRSIVQSFIRSAQLVRGSFFRVATIFAVFLGIQALFVLIVSLILMSDSFIVNALVATVIHIAITPFQATALNLLYFELRAEREAFDFERFRYEARKQLTA